MLFHTWVFAVFFLIVYPVYLLVRKNNRLMNIWLMIASYTFYGWWNPVYLLLLFGTSAIDYAMVLLMERSGSRGRKLWLIISLVSNFGFLGYFKYSGFLTANVNALCAHFGIGLQLPDPVAYPNSVLAFLGLPEDRLFTQVILPIGISFHTFQSMSYTIDAYRGEIQTERSFIRFLTFVSFFPQLVAGPIERASNLLPQLQASPRITGQDLADGLSLFVVGFFKKVALADYLALYVDRVYDAPSQFGASSLLLATVAFAWQIYFDFSGYTDMARGIARVMGFRMMLNFNNPYTATDLGDFWSRWHISLSTWFKDYLYYPLGGNRKGEWITYRNLIITFVVSGVWHGANWTFAVWGALHALGRCCTRGLERADWYTQKVPRLLKQTWVFSFVCFAWIFFRAQSLQDAWLIIHRIATGEWVDPGFPVLLLLLVLSVWVYQFLFTSGPRCVRLLSSAPLRVGLVIAMIVYLLTVAQPGSRQFIYFQF